MVKHFNEQLRKEELIHEDKLLEKAELIRKLRRKDLIKDTKRNCLKRNIEYKPPKININQFIQTTSEQKFSSKFDETQKEVHSYKVALQNTQKILKQLDEMQIKNERPADYLVQMYKSDKQMFKVRRYLTERQEKLKEKLQGKDWQSKTKRRQRAKKKAEGKREKKKNKLEEKRKTGMKLKPKVTKVNGKNKIKKIKK